MKTNCVILIADDDPVMRRAYKALLEGEGFAVRLARDGDEAVRKFTEERPDLVLMDVMMPRMNGHVACREIRAIDAVTPVIFVTAMPSEVSLVRGLGFGGDDYIDKARPSAELVARINAALRRRAAFAQARDIVRVGGVTIDLEDMTVADGEAPPARLTSTEARIIRLLNDERGSFVATDRLLDAVVGDGDGDATLVRKHISRLKAKLGRARDMIQNAPNAGYCLVK